MPYPTRQAALIVSSLNDVAARAGAEVFVGELETCGQGEDYRSVTVDVTASDWRRIQAKLLATGWKPFAGTTLVYSLPDGAFLLIEPNM